MQPTLEIYKSRIDLLQQQLQILTAKQNRFGWLRLIIIVVTIVAAYQVFVAAGAWAWLVVLIGLVLFLFLVSADADNNSKLLSVKTLVKINEEEIQLLHNNFSNKYDGNEWMPGTHYYAADLDVFGKFSLYQYINRCYTEQGRELLANNFLNALDLSEITKRHEALNELRSEVEWRQQLQSVAMQTAVTKRTEQKILHWLSQKNDAFTNSSWKVILPLYCLITLSTLVATILGYIHPSVFSFLFVIYLIISVSLSKKPTKAYMQLSGITDQVFTVQQIVQCIESKTFTSTLLNEIKSSVKSGDENASGQIKKLKDILNRFDLRLNVFVFIFLNSLLLWDVWQMMALNRWKEKNSESAANWFNMIAKFEVLNSLATLHFNKPTWSLPHFETGYFTFKGKNLGHPLIPEDQRVDNSFSLVGTGKIALVTGSNMAGKSTFLRSLGVNTVLAQMGAPVCAAYLQLSPVNLISSMRIADNLAENTSTFYAELKKLQTIIEAVKKGEPLFILLDEILRGTNSLDRHIGSKALIKQLIKNNSIAVIATHDVELAKLSEEQGDAVENYHFDVQVGKGEELYFDYKLKEGVCTSLNASILMRKIGIELGEEG